MKDKVIIITLNYNQNDYTIKCIKSILKSEYENYQVLLLDNGSAAENYYQLQKELPDDARLFLIRIEENLGYVGGINFGLVKGANLRPDYFMIINNDTILDRMAIKEMTKTCKDFNNKAIITGKVYFYDEPNKFQYIGSRIVNKNLLKFESIGANEIDAGQYDKIIEFDMIDDIFWLFPFSLYVEIGSYSQNFYFNGESTDYCLRAMSKKYRLIYTPNAKLWHKGSITIGGREDNPIFAYWITQSTLVLRYLHLTKKQFRWFYVRYFIDRIVIRFFKSLIKFLLLKKSFKIFNANISAFRDFKKWVVRRSSSVWQPPL